MNKLALKMLKDHNIIEHSEFILTPRHLEKLIEHLLKELQQVNKEIIEFFKNTILDLKMLLEK